MNKMTKKLLLSVLTVVLTVIALGTTTFAWFTLTNTANVQPFEAEVVADVGIEVSLDGLLNEGVWVTTITTAMIDAYIAEKYGDFFFNAVTTSNGRNMFGFTNPTQLDPAGGQFLEIGIQIRSNSSTLIYWEDASLAQVPAGGLNWTSDVSFTTTTGTTVAANAPVSIDVSNGIRMAVDGGGLAEDILVYEKPGVAVGVLATGAGNTVLGGGIKTVTRDLAGITVNTDGLLNGAISYYYSKTGTLPEEVEQFGGDPLASLGTYVATANTVGTFTSFTTGPKGDILDRLATTLTAGGLGEDIGAVNSGSLTIRIWLEGWDPDTYNAVLSRLISASFRFSAPE